MWEHTTELVRQKHGDVRLETKAVSLERDEHGVSRVLTHGPSGRETLEADHVISSMPLGELVLAMSPLPPEHVIEAAKALTHRDFLTVALVVPEAQSFPDNWIYVHDPSVKLGRVQNFRAWSPDMVKPGHTCLGLEYFVFEGDELWKMADDDLVAFAIEEITRINLIPPNVVQAGYVVRVPQAYPRLRRRLRRARRNDSPLARDGDTQRAPGRSKRDAPLQQSRPFDAHRDAHRRKHQRCPPRHLDGERRGRVPRKRQSRERTSRVGGSTVEDSRWRLGDGTRHATTDRSIVAR